jgi:ribosomal protein S18 acetylase RimI-like enzyme
MDFADLQLVLPGFEVRAARLDDVLAITALIARVTTAAVGKPDATETEVRDDLNSPRFDIDQDSILAIRSDGEVVVFGKGYAEHDEVAWVDIYVDPHFGDDEFAAVSDAAVGAAIARIKEAARAKGISPERIQAGLYQEETRAREAYERAGLVVDSLYWRMEIAVSADADYSSVLDDGVEIRRVDPNDDAVMRAALDLANEAFSEHHGFVVESYEDYRERWLSAESFDPQGWWFAFVDGRHIGHLLADESRAESGSGYVRSLGVLKEARGRGIARALLLTSFDYYRQLGRQTVQLGVDSENTTGATRLYESVGMKPILSISGLRMPLV